MPREPVSTAAIFSDQPEQARDHAVKVRNNLQWLEALLDELAHFAASARRLSHIASSLPHPNILGIDMTNFYNACQVLQMAGVKLSSVANTQSRARIHNAAANFTGELSRASSNIYLESKRRAGNKPFLSGSKSPETSPSGGKHVIDHMPKILEMLEAADCEASNLFERDLQKLMEAMRSFTEIASKAAEILSTEVNSADLGAAMEGFLAAGEKHQLPIDCLDYRAGYAQVLYNDEDNDDYIINAYNRNSVNPISALSARESLSGSGLGNSYKARSPAFGSKGPRSPSSKTTSLLQIIMQRQQNPHECDEPEEEEERSGSD